MAKLTMEIIEIRQMPNEEYYEFVLLTRLPAVRIAMTRNEIERFHLGDAEITQDEN